MNPSEKCRKRQEQASKYRLDLHFSSCLQDKHDCIFTKIKGTQVNIQ